MAQDSSAAAASSSEPPRLCVSPTEPARPAGAPQDAWEASLLARPQRSSLTRQRHCGRQAVAAAGVSFADASTDSTIESFSSLADELWYPGFAVSCDRCERAVKWGAEGSIMGAPGRSRFSQWQVLCNGCLADRLYGEIGAWLVVALAADRGGGVNGCVAHGPVSALLEGLLKLCPGTGNGSDQLSMLLGKEAEAPDVRAVVLQKARTHIGRLLGLAPSSVNISRAMKRELSDEAPEANPQGGGAEPAQAKRKRLGQ